MWTLIGIILASIIVGTFCYVLGDYHGYYDGLEDCGYELNGEGELVKREDYNG